MPVTEGTREHSWSFDQIYEEYKTPIYKYVYHLLGDREQAEDVTQDTFLKAFRALPKMDATLKLSAWLYRIATNTACDALRRRKLIAWLPWQALDYQPAEGARADLQETYETIELVRAALRRMPQRLRAALLLYTWEGFSYSEIAQTLNIKESGVRMYLTRSRESFRGNYRAIVQESTTTPTNKRKDGGLPCPIPTQAEHSTDKLRQGNKTCSSSRAS